MNDQVKVKTKKKRKYVIGGGIVFILVLFVVSAEYTSHSGFCDTCHYMKPFYKSWKESSHREIECSSCHYGPGVRSKLRAKVEGLMQVGRYWTKLYLKSKPWAEIPDESCLKEGCHEKRLLEGRVKFQKIVFDHKIHFEDLKRGKRLRCTSCHSQIVQGEHITVTESTCFICHFKESEHYPKISQCSHCHIREDLTSTETSRYNHSLVYENGFACDKCHSQIIIGDGAVPRENCYKCHWERDRLDKFDDTDLMHSTHITASKIECNQCHLDIQHKIVKDIEAIADCRTCHTNFHQAQKVLYSGEGGRGIPHPEPNIMLVKGLSCKGCHIFHEESGGRLVKSDTLISQETACESCHGRGFSRIFRNWEIATEKKLGQIKRIYSRALEEIRKTKGLRRENALKKLQDAEFNIDLVERGKSVHNFTYSQELLLAAYTFLTEALQSADSSYQPEKFQAVVRDVPTQCSQCHSGIEEIESEIFGLQFAHEPHILKAKMECSSCHSNVRIHGEFTSSKKQCASCHHAEPKQDCGSCHALQKAFYEGGQVEGWEIPRDMMAEAEVGCTDCHLDDGGRIFRSNAAKCVSCHEEVYEETFTDWQRSFRDLQNQLLESLRQKKNEPLTPESKAELAKIERTLAKLLEDGSLGVHNFVFMEEILTTLGKKIKPMTD